jgi:hypothetical protein
VWRQGRNASCPPIIIYISALLVVGKGGAKPKTAEAKNDAKSLASPV